MFLRNFSRSIWCRLALGLAVLSLFGAVIGCGGDTTNTDADDEFYVGGSVIGLEAAGLVLKNSDGQEVTVDADGDFWFAEKIEDGADFNVTIADAPADHDCTVHNGSGAIDGEDVVDVEVVCDGPSTQIEPADFSVSINADTSTLEVSEGGTVVVVANITNNGDEADTQDITLEIDGELQDTIPDLEIEGGDTEGISLEWTTAVGDVGSYTAEVASDDDSETASLTVEPPEGEAYFTVSLNEGASVLEAAEGEDIVVAANVVNIGDVTGTQDIVLEIGGDIVTVEDVEMTAGFGDTVVLEWPTEIGDAGDHTAEISSDNDTESAEVTVTPYIEPGYFDVSIDSASSDLQAEEGGTISIDVDVENTGEETVTQDVVMNIGPDFEATETAVELDGGASQTLTFDWVTETGDAGLYTAEVASDDTSDTESVTVNPPAGNAHLDVAIDETASTLDVEHGQEVIVVVHIGNLGDTAATQNIILEIDGTEEDVDVDLDVPAGDSTTVTLYWQTEVGDAGTYMETYTAEVKSDDSADTASVTVTDPDAASILSGVVTDSEPTGSSFEGVDMFLYEAGTDTVAATTVVGVDGAYEFPEVIPGDYDLVLEAAGLEPNYEIDEAGGENWLEISLGSDTEQDLTVDWMRSTHLMIDGGLIDFQYGDPDGQLAVPLPGCQESAGGSWDPEEIDTGDDSLEVTLDPDNECFQINDVGIDLVTGDLLVDVEDILFPNVTVFMADGSAIDEMVDSLEVDFDWQLDNIGGHVDFTEGSMDVDIDLRILIGGTVFVDPFGMGTPIEIPFGSRDGDNDCQLTAAWGGDVNNPQLDANGDQNGEYLHDPLQLRLTTGVSGPDSLEGMPYDSATGYWLTVDNAMEMGQLSEGSLGANHPGGASCGSQELASIDFASTFNEMLELPAGEGSIFGEFNFVAP